MIVLANKEKDLRNASERSLRETRRDIDRKINEIRSELQEIGPEAVEKVQGSLDDLKAELQKEFEVLNDGLEEQLETGRKQVREHPFLAVGVAVMAGVIVGMLLGKNKD